MFEGLVLAFSCHKFRSMEKNSNSRLHLLKTKISGFRLLSDSFELDLTGKARVFEKDLEKEVEEVDKGLFAFIASPSSGAIAAANPRFYPCFLK